MIDGRNFYDQPINDIIKQYDEIRKVSTGYGYDYTTGSLLNYAYFKDNCRLIVVDLSKQKALDTDPRAIQQIVFQGVVWTSCRYKNKTIHYFWKIKRNNTRICKKSSKSSVISINGWMQSSKC